MHNLSMKRLGLACCFACMALAPASAQPLIEIADGRVQRPNEDLSDWDERPAILSARAAVVDYWESESPDFDAGFWMLGVAGGAFTRPGAAETAVLFGVGESGRCCPHGGLAIVRAGRLVRVFAVHQNNGTLTALPDIDTDGRSEIALTGYGMGQGYVQGGVSIGQVTDAGFDRWGGHMILSDDCGALGTEVVGTRLLAERSAPVRLFSETFRQERCSTQDAPSPRWRLETPRTATQLDPELGAPVVSLPTR